MSHTSEDDVTDILVSRLRFAGLFVSHCVFPLGGALAGFLPSSKYESSLLNCFHLIRACDEALLRSPSTENSNTDEEKNVTGVPFAYKYFVQEITDLNNRDWIKSAEAHTCFRTISSFAQNHDNIRTFVHYRCYAITQLRLELFRQNPSYYDQPSYSQDRHLYFSTLFVSPTLLLGYTLKKAVISEEAFSKEKQPWTFLKFVNNLYQNAKNLNWKPFKAMEKAKALQKIIIPVLKTSVLIELMGSAYLFNHHLWLYRSNTQSK